jgi:hypothetical protein
MRVPAAVSWTCAPAQPGNSCTIADVLAANSSKCAGSRALSRPGGRRASAQATISLPTRAGSAERGPVGDQAAKAEAEQIGLGDSQIVQQRDHVTGQLLDRHRPAGISGMAVALELHRDHLPARRSGPGRPLRACALPASASRNWSGLDRVTTANFTAIASGCLVAAQITDSGDNASKEFKGTAGKPRLCSALAVGHYDDRPCQRQRTQGARARGMKRVLCR